jgi:iron complex outermembrane receptor protein
MKDSYCVFEDTLAITSQLSSKRLAFPGTKMRFSWYEVGVKKDWFGGRISSTITLYEITKTNVLTADPQHQTFSVQTGEQRSRGVRGCHG